MGRAPCCDKKGLKKGPWTSDEDEKLVDYINKHGHGSWRSFPKRAGLLRCGKSCRLRWTNYLRPGIKRGPFSLEEEKLVIQLHAILGNRWAAIASHLQGRTDNEIKNLWNSHLQKRLLRMGIDPQTHEPSTIFKFSSNQPPLHSSTHHMAQWENARLEAEARLSMDSPPLIPTSTEKSYHDHFLRLWNSGIGEAFRKLKNGENRMKSSCQSPLSYSLTKCGSISETTTELGHVHLDSSAAEGSKLNEHSETVKPELDSSSSNELEDSSESTLQLLLDFPCNNDMSFLEHTNWW